MENKNKQAKIAVIVPAYNEEKQISRVLDVVTKMPLASEVVVVDDGSTDQTSKIARSYDVTLLIQPENRGKGAALQRGINSTDADIVVSIDADLVGLTVDHIKDLVQPLLEDEEVMMTVGKFASGRLPTDLAQKLVPQISGQRAMRRTFLDKIPDLSPTGYGVEVAITKYARRLKVKVKEVHLSETTQVMKEEKRGFIKGVLDRAKMYRDMIIHLWPTKKPG